MELDDKYQVKYRTSHIHNWTDPTDFDSDLFSVDKLWIGKRGKVEYAKRVFCIPAPKWLRRLVFGPDKTS